MESLLESLLGFAARFTTFAGVLLSLGAVVFRMYVLQRADVSAQTKENAAKRAANIALFAAFAVVPAAFVKLWLQTAEMRFPDDPWVSIAVKMVTETAWGTTWLAQLVCALLLIPALMYAKRATVRATVRGWIPAAIFAVALAVTPSTASHAMSAEKFAAITLYVDVTHVFAASAWIGTLFVLYRSVSGRDATGDDGARYLPQLLGIFSPLALTCGALIAISGLISALSHINALSEFYTTHYGQALIAKVTSVALVALFGWRNFRYLTPALATSGSAPMRKGMLLELAAVTVVLIVTAILVVTPPPMNGMNMDMGMTSHSLGEPAVY